MNPIFFMKQLCYTARQEKRLLVRGVLGINVGLVSCRCEKTTLLSMFPRTLLKSLVVGSVCGYSEHGG